MAIKLAILGLDLVQRDWLEAVAALRASGEIELTGVGHSTLATAKDVADALKSPPAAALSSAFAAPPAFDDLRLMLKESTPQVILMDRPGNAKLEFLLACLTQNTAILSLGPPVESFAEARSLAAVLEPRSHLLYIWPRFADAPASRHFAQADDFVRPFRFASASWMGLNYALAKTFAADAGAPLPDLPVRSLSVLAWDALATLIRLIDLPTSVYCVIRGTVGSGNTFADLSGAAALALRFPDDAAASVTLCDRAMPAADPHSHTDLWNRRDLLLWGAGGTIKLNSHAYEFRDADGHLIDAGPPPNATEGIHAGASIRPARSPALDTLREFLRHYSLPPSPHRGWEHRLEDVAATMEALVVSHRTGQAESPERFRKLRR
jgi:predicted dehydrogenase